MYLMRSGEARFTKKFSIHSFEPHRVTCDVLHKMDVVGRRNGEEAEAAVPPDAPFAAAETVLKFTPDNENVYHVQRLTREMASAPSSPVRQLTCHLPESSWQSLDDDEFECGTAHNSRSVFLVVKIAVDGNIEMVGGHHALACPSPSSGSCLYRGQVRGAWGPSPQPAAARPCFQRNQGVRSCGCRILR